MEISISFSWALNPHIINFRFSLAAVFELYQPDNKKGDLMLMLF